ncbi:MAG: DUF2716 domain-containing protein [Actinomycetia bacterium]|nr:DUF2716 domain-containing protein [Actinomycetes bacterium]
MSTRSTGSTAPSFRFYPQHATPPHAINDWLVPVLPDGDYYLYLARDLRFGWLTHPWEQSVCVYGPLLAEMQQTLDDLGLPVIRHCDRA